MRIARREIALLKQGKRQTRADKLRVTHVSCRQSSLHSSFGRARGFYIGAVVRRHRMYSSSRGFFILGSDKWIVTISRRAAISHPSGTSTRTVRNLCGELKFPSWPCGFRLDRTNLNREIFYNKPCRINKLHKWGPVFKGLRPNFPQFLLICDWTRVAGWSRIVLPLTPDLLLCEVLL